MLLLHGWSQHADEWWNAGYVDALSDSYRIIAIDRLGHGESDKPHDPVLYHEEHSVADLVALLDAEHVDRVLVWGYSMGARYAASLAIMHPERVVAVVCGGRMPMGGTEALRQEWIAGGTSMNTTEALEAMLRGFDSTDESVHDSLARNDPQALSACWIGGAEYFPSGKDVKAPMLWYQGSNDLGGFSNPELELAQQVNAETHLIDGASHSSAFQRSADVVRIVRPFLDKAAI